MAPQPVPISLIIAGPAISKCAHLVPFYTNFCRKAAAIEPPGHPSTLSLMQSAYSHYKS